MGTVQVSRVQVGPPAAPSVVAAAGSSAGDGTALLRPQFVLASAGSSVGDGSAAIGATYIGMSMWDKSVLASSTEVIRVEIWDGNTLKGIVKPKGGSGVTADFVTGTRRMMQATFDPSVAALLTPGVILKPYRGFDYYFGQPELEPLGCFPLNGTVSDLDPAADIQVSCSDTWQWVVSSTFLTGFTATAGLRVKDILTDLVLDTGMWKASQIINTISSNAVATTQVWDTDRGQAIADLCKAVGAEAFPDRMGNIILRDRRPRTTPVGTFRTGDGGRIEAGSVSLDIADVYNMVIVIPSNPDPAFPLAAVKVKITDRTHPAYAIRGVRVTRPYRLDQGQATSQAQLLAMAQKVLTKISAAARQVTFQCLVDVRLDESDTFVMQWPTGLLETLQIQQITYPFNVADSQQIVGVSTRSDEDFQP